MATMTKTSKAVVYHDDFKAALEAAIKVASDKDYEAVQLRFVDEMLLICAINTKATFVAEVATEFCDIIAPRDEILELSKKEATALLKFPIKAPKDSEDMAKSGLLISESYVQLTDETGLGVGIRHLRVRRETQPGLPGNPPRAVEAAKQAADAEPGALTVGPGQILLAGQIASIMGEPATVLAMKQDTSPLSRIVLTGPSYGLTVSTEVEQGDQVQEQQGPSGDEIPLVSDLGPRLIRRIESKPPPGAA